MTNCIATLPNGKRCTGDLVQQLSKDHLNYDKCGAWFQLKRRKDLEYRKNKSQN